MYELFFYDEKVFKKLSKADYSEYQAIFLKLQIPYKRPFILKNGCIEKELDKFFDYLIVPKRRSVNTWATYANQLILFLKFLEAQNVEWKDVTKFDISNYFMVRTSGNHQNLPAITDRSWNLTATTIVHLYEFALEENLITKVPFNYKKSKAKFYNNFKNSVTSDLNRTITTKTLNIISIKDYKERWRPAVLSRGLSLRNIALCDLLVSTGLRITEALNLKVLDIPDPDNISYAGRKSVTIQIIGKGSKLRYVRIPKRIIRSIRWYIEEERSLDKNNSSDYLFLSINGTRLDSRSVEQLFFAISKSLDLKLTPHGCRHTFATYQLQSMIKKALLIQKEIKVFGADAYSQIINDPLRILQELLGHSSILTTYIYVHYLSECEALINDSLNEWTTWEVDNGK